MDGSIDCGRQCDWVQHLHEARIDGFSTRFATCSFISMANCRNFFSIRRNDHGRGGSDAT